MEGREYADSVSSIELIHILYTPYFSIARIGLQNSQKFPGFKLLSPPEGLR